MRNITNQEFEEALKNEDYKRIMNSAASHFRMDQDDIYSCQLEALWKTLKNFNGKKKFTSYLYDNVKWCCSLFIKKNKSRHYQLKYSPVSNYHSYIEVDDYINSLEHKELFRQRYIENLSLDEIAKKNNLTKFKAGKLIRDSAKQIKKIIMK